MQMAGVDDFNVGGTIHVIVNNQIGFTTNPINSRSTPYASDLGKAFNCPIFHVNGDDPVAVSKALDTAIEWRHEWGGDVIIDMICYRRLGHNELDQPMFTQPKLYKAITRHQSTLDIYEKKLIEEGTMSKEEAKEIRDFTLQSYEKDYEESKSYVPRKRRLAELAVDGVQEPQPAQPHPPHWRGHRRPAIHRQEGRRGSRGLQAPPPNEQDLQVSRRHGRVGDRH